MSEELDPESDDRTEVPVLNYSAPRKARRRQQGGCGNQLLMFSAGLAAGSIVSYFTWSHHIQTRGSSDAWMGLLWLKVGVFVITYVIPRTRPAAVGILASMPVGLLIFVSLCGPIL
jgi:hypothetical protein